MTIFWCDREKKSNSWILLKGPAWSVFLKYQSVLTPFLLFLDALWGYLPLPSILQKATIAISGPLNVCPHSSNTVLFLLYEWWLLLFQSYLLECTLLFTSPELIVLPLLLSPQYSILLLYGLLIIISSAFCVRSGKNLFCLYLYAPCLVQSSIHNK